MTLNQVHKKADKQKIVYDTMEIVKKQLLPHYATTMMAAFAMQLHDKHGWGRKRLETLLTSVGDLFDSVQGGYLSLDDIVKTVEAETGINLKEMRGRCDGTQSNS